METKKNLHIMNNDKFSKPYIEFINENFDSEQHIFVFLENDISLIEKIYEADNVIDLTKVSQIKKYIYLTKYILAYKKIFLHGLFKTKQNLYYALNPWMFKKAYWVIWGGDLYEYMYRDANPKIKRKLLYTFNDFVKGNISNYVSLVKSDYDLACQVLKNPSARYFEGMYVNPVTLTYLDSIYRSDNDDIVNIQIGNSASESNQHIEVLDYLSKYKKENINIYVPLSYSGSEEYIEKVIHHGKKIFGNKFIPLLEFMNPEEYAGFLGKIDIALFNNNRQQALGNIFALAYLGKKLYLRNDTTMWEQFIDYENYKLNSIQSIEQKNFENFKYISEEEININHTESKKRFDPEYMKEVWEKIFES